MEIINQLLMAVIFAVSPLIGYWLYTLAPREVAWGRSWLFAALAVAISGMAYLLLANKKSPVFILAAGISLGFLVKEWIQVKIGEKTPGRTTDHGLWTGLILGSVWFFILLLGFEGLRTGLIEVSSTMIISGLILGSLAREKYNAVILGIVPVVMAVFEFVV